MNLMLEGRTCLVTGASSGIGAGVARLLALQGARVAGIARRAEQLQELGDEAGASNIKQKFTAAWQKAETPQPYCLISAEAETETEQEQEQSSKTE